jgi:hypothetical protein
MAASVLRVTALAPPGSGGNPRVACGGRRPLMTGGAVRVTNLTPPGRCVPSATLLLEKQIEYGIEGLIVGGTTGEGQLMSWDEHIMLIAHTSKLYGDKLQIVGNTGSNSTREAVHATSQGFAVGEDVWIFFGFFEKAT